MIECRCGIDVPSNAQRSVNCAKYAQYQDTWYWEVYVGQENQEQKHTRTVVFICKSIHRFICFCFDGYDSNASAIKF